MVSLSLNLIPVSSSKIRDDSFFTMAEDLISSRLPGILMLLARPHTKISLKILESEVGTSLIYHSIISTISVVSTEGE